MAGLDSVAGPRLYWVLLAYALCYNPTLALVNAVAFNQMTSPEKQFPAVRVYGTIGWIVAGLVVGFLGLEVDQPPRFSSRAGCSILARPLLLHAAPHAAAVARPQASTVRTFSASTR